MITIIVDAGHEVDVDSGEYMGATLDHIYDCGHIALLVEEDEIDADYRITVDCWPDEAHGIPFAHRSMEIAMVRRCVWNRHRILNAEDVIWEIEEHRNL